jgi:hypothetical protein
VTFLVEILQVVCVCVCTILYLSRRLEGDRGLVFVFGFFHDKIRMSFSLSMSVRAEAMT